MEKTLAEFLKFIDFYTFTIEGKRYHRVDKEPITNEELVVIFLNSDANPN